MERERPEDAIFPPARNVRERRNLFVSLYMHRVGSSERKFFSRCVPRASRFGILSIPRHSRS